MTDNAVAAAVAPGYQFEGPVLELGGLMLDETQLSDVHIRIPLGMLNRHGLVAGATGTGIPLRVTMTSFGPLLLSKVLGLNETQESSLGLIFHYADQAGLPLL